MIDCDTFISQPHAEVVYMVLVAHYPSCVDCSNPLSNLQGALHGILLKAPQSQLLTAEFTEVEEYPALDFTTRTPEGYLLGRLIMANNSLYQILTVNASGGDEPDSHESFVRSFGFLCRQPSFQ